MVKSTVSPTSLAQIRSNTPYSITAFQSRVYTLLLQVPPGRVTTYAAISRALSSSPRAVGNALRNNPFAPDVPCHRVVASTGFVNGFNGEVVAKTTFQVDEEGAVKGSVSRSVPKGAKVLAEGERQRSDGQGGQVSEKLRLLGSEGVEFDGKGMLSEKSRLFDGPWDLKGL